MQLRPFFSLTELGAWPFSIEHCQDTLRHFYTMSKQQIFSLGHDFIQYFKNFYAKC